MSSKLDLASGWRNSDLGVKIISWCSKNKETKTRWGTWSTPSCVIFLAQICTYRLPKGKQDLSADNVEVVCRSGAADNDPVTVMELMHCEVFRQFLTGKVGKTVTHLRFMYLLLTPAYTIYYWRKMPHYYFVPKAGLLSYWKSRIWRQICIINESNLPSRNPWHTLPLKTMFSSCSFREKLLYKALVIVAKSNFDIH